MPYPEKFREIVLSHIEQGAGLGATAKQFKVGRTTLYRWIERKKETGSLKDPPPKRPWKKLDPEILKIYVKENPDFLGREYALHFGVSIVGILKALRRLGFSRKKKLNVTEKEMNKYVWILKDK